MNKNHRKNQFPKIGYDRDIASSIRSNHIELFELSEEIFNAAITLITDRKIDLRKARGVGSLTHNVSIGVYNKICKLFRGIYLLAGSGMSREADILARSQFEAVLAYYFLMKPRLTLRQNGKKLDPVPGKSLTTKFRTSLYLARRAFESLRKVEYYARTPGFKQFAKKFNKATLKTNAERWEAKIGPEWTKRLKRTRMYSGVKLKDLATSLGLNGAYDAAYWIYPKIVDTPNSKII